MKIVSRSGWWRLGSISAPFMWAMALGIPTRPTIAQEVGEVFQDCDVCPAMVVVPGGTFLMGSPEAEEGRDPWEEPQHRVTMGYALAVSVYEVTFDEWEACVRGGGCEGYEPADREWGRGKRPVINVSWNDAWWYADWLTEQTGQEYRLLSEAEWEYVARAGTRTARYWGDTAQEQCRYGNGYDAVAHAVHGFSTDPVGCRDRQGNTAPVGSYRPNRFGLYDMLGNVEEWVDDCENTDYDGAPTDGSAWYTGDCSVRVYRGGSWRSEPEELRAAYRMYSSVDYRSSSRGFRIARAVN